MRIAIDARKLRDFGIGTYIRNILIELSRLDQSTAYVVLCRPDDVESGEVLGRNCRMVPEPAPTYSLAEQIRIPISLWREGVRLVHEPHYVLPPAIRCRAVVTIHDCIHLMFPQYLPSRLAYVYAKASIWTATRKADRILTVSEASKRDILRFFDVPPDKVSVIYNGIDERFLGPADTKRMDLVRQRYQLVDPHDTDAIAGGIRRAVNDEPLRADLIARGLARARQFSWAQSVAKIHRIYMEVAGTYRQGCGGLVGWWPSAAGGRGRARAGGRLPGITLQARGPARVKVSC